MFPEIVRREVRRGGCMMLQAENADPGIPGGRATIVTTHLEDRTKPEGRRKQMEELLFLVDLPLDEPPCLARHAAFDELMTNNSRGGI